MGFIKKLFGAVSPSRAQELPNAVTEAIPSVHQAHIKGDGTFSVEVVGESHYQAALERAAGGRSEDGANKVVVAELALEDSNPYDSQAVAVRVLGETVGYLPRDSAREFRKQISALGVPPGIRMVCDARINGGWSREGGRNRGHFGIRLDFLTGDS
ncbi:MAG: hypothetical protein F9K18_01720 [Thermoanaerobaculia bacterium]|nr:MAG: hypothetical protein F9K18_01720 [Thermoanaerobaculia bacterium]